MARAVITTVDETPTGAFPVLAGVRARGEVESRGVISGPDRPIWLWSHRLAPGAELRWNRPPVGHALYVRDGAVEADGQALAADGAVMIKHGGAVTVAAGPDGAHLLHFHRPDDYPHAPARAGGHVHVVPAAQAIHYAPSEGVVYADSGCPTCELWLHSNRMTAETGGAPPHMHTEDEIIVVIEGAMSFGTRTLPAGTALAIDEGTVYGFSPGEPFLKFINFRPCDPYYVPISKAGKGRPISERLAVAALARGGDGAAAVLDAANMT